MKIKNRALPKIKQHSAGQAIALPRRLTQKITIAILTTVMSIGGNANFIQARPIDADRSDSVGLPVTLEKVGQIALSKRTTKKNKTRSIYLDTKSEDPFTQAFFRFARQAKFLETFASRLDSIRLPRPTRFVMKDCGVANTFYDSSGSITLCSEFITYVNQTFIKGGYSKRAAFIKTADAIIFILFHEVGHLLIRELDLPITGKEEDAADQFAAYTFLSGPKSDRNSILRQRQVISALQLLVLTKDDLRSSSTFTSSHSLNRQRAYYLVCELYIKDSDYYAELALKLGYRSESLATCRQNSYRIRRSWNSLLAPHFIR